MQNNKEQKIKTLILEAKTRLMAGNDPLHDESHAERVAMYAKKIATRSGVTNEHEIRALELAAWWHDVSRTITKKPSFLLMPLLDDTLSAIMLMIMMVRVRSFNRTTLLALRLVVSKSQTIGKLFSRVFLTKRLRLLLSILQDADTVDTFAAERTDVIHALVDNWWGYKQGYRLMGWYFISTSGLKVKTAAAIEFLLHVVKEFYEWAMQDHIRLWHIEQYGKKWFEQMLIDVRQLLARIEKEYSLQAVTVS